MQKASIAELQAGYLSLVQAELADYGILPEQVRLNSQGQIEVEDHLIDMLKFGEFTAWSRPDMILRAYTVDNGYLVFMPTRPFYEEYRAQEALETELEQLFKAAQKRIDELSKEYFTTVSELHNHKTVAQRISAQMAHNLQITEDLSAIASWKAKVLLGNSLGKDSPQVGEWDNIGYTHIGLNTGTIVPVARGDEHHRGYDLIHELVNQGVIPADTYYPLAFSGDYVNGFDGMALQAMKIWRQLKGPNFVIKNSSNNSGLPFQLTVDDYLKAEGQIEINPGELLPLGKELLSHFKKLSTLTVEFRKTQRGEKAVYVQALKTLNFYQNKIIQFPTTSFIELKNQVLAAERVGELAGLQQLEEAIFGFNGLKNQLHQEIRKALDPQAFSFQKNEMLAIFGDLDLANHELGAL